MTEWFTFPIEALSSSVGLSPMTPLMIVMTLSLSVALSQGLALCYELTYEGLSYQRRFVHSLTLTTLVSCTLMLSIGGSLALGLGVLGAMAMVRFRTNIRDIWDMTFLFCALTIGFACGARQPWVAILCTLFFCVIAWISVKGRFGATHHFDGVVQIWRRAEQSGPDLEEVLGRSCLRASLVSLREGGQGDYLELSYQITFHRDARREALVEDLRGLSGVSEVSLLLQDDHLEL